jgi:hypothetical protein
MPDCGHSHEQHELHGCPDIGMPPLSQDKTAQMLGLVPTFDEATDESHRSHHEPTWEISANGEIACSLCGWSYRLT